MAVPGSLQFSASDVAERGAQREEEPGGGGAVTPGSRGKSAFQSPKFHELENAWAFWFDNPNARQKQSWGKSLREVYSYSTAEDFWCLYCNILTPSRLPHGADFHCFKKGIEPKWEDPTCAGGGKWTLHVRREKLDTLWLHTVLAMIGEQFEGGEDICGAVVSIRAKQDRVAIWTKTAKNKDLQMGIARTWKKLLDAKEKIGFIAHDDAKRDERRAKERYWLD